MGKRIKIKPNDPCPCLSGLKAKHCSCRGRVDWPSILRSNQNPHKYLSVRGRNLIFAEAIADALQLNTMACPSLADFKKAFTPSAVRKIHEAIVAIWPADTDLHSVLERAGADVSGLYIGLAPCLAAMMTTPTT